MAETEERQRNIMPLSFFSDLAGTLTQDLRNRNPTLYTTKLRGLIEYEDPPPYPSTREGSIMYCYCRTWSVVTTPSLGRVRGGSAAGSMAFPF